MTTSRKLLQPSFILHSKPYRDTSLLIDLLTVSNGRISVIARGAKNTTSKSYGLLAPYIPLLVSYSGKGDLPTLTQVETEETGNNYTPSGKILLIGFYLNELLIKLLPKYDPYPNIYYKYKETLLAIINSSQPETPLRLFEKSLLKELGYGLYLIHTVDGEPILPTEKYSFEFGVGLKKMSTNNKNTNNFSGQSLLALHHENLTTVTELQESKRLLRFSLNILLGGKPLKSRELFVF